VDAQGAIIGVSMEDKGVRCPRCGGESTVTGKRKIAGFNKRWRRCKTCNLTFTTREKLEPSISGLFLDEMAEIPCESEPPGATTEVNSTD